MQNSTPSLVAIVWRITKEANIWSCPIREITSITKPERASNTIHKDVTSVTIGLDGNARTIPFGCRNTSPRSNACTQPASICLRSTILENRSKRNTLTNAAMHAPRNQAVKTYIKNENEFLWFAECASWVFHSDTKMCQLKNRYIDDESKKIECKNCKAYDKSGKAYVYQSTSAMTYTTTWSSDKSSWKSESFGSGSSWTLVSSSSAHTCTFRVGYDQPKEYNIGEASIFDSAYECCIMCTENESEDCYLAMSLKWIAFERLSFVGMERSNARMLPQEQIRPRKSNAL